MKKLYIIIAALAIAGGLSYWIVSSHGTSTKQSSSGGINYGPATKQDKAYSDSRKKASVQNTGDSSSSNQGSSTTQQTQTNTTTTKSSVSPVITTHYQSNGNLTVNGFVQGVVEDGGTCTLTLTKQGVTVQQTHPGAVNASTTTCGGIVVPLDKLSAGDWQAILSYSSEKYQGASSSVSITVQ